MRHLTDTDIALERGAQLSDCGAYRYRLWREWDTSCPTLAFLMLNPSTADHRVDDPTITRCLTAQSRTTLDGLKSPTCSRCGRPTLMNSSRTRIRLDPAIRPIARSSMWSIVRRWSSARGAHTRRGDARHRSDAPASHHRDDKQALSSRPQPGRRSEAPAICRGQHAAPAICFPSGFGMRELVTTTVKAGLAGTSSGIGRPVKQQTYAFEALNFGGPTWRN